MSDKRTNSPKSSLALGALACTALFTVSPASANATDLSPSGETISVFAPMSPDVMGDASDRTYSPEGLDALGGDPRVIEYWTPNRMAEAIPVETPVAPNTQTAEPGDVERSSSQETHESAVAEPAEATDTQRYALPKTTPVTNFTKTNGKVFYRDATDGLNYVCSGSSINSGSKRLVSTAGHCVHGGPGGTWHQNWVFVPAYFEGSRPYGTFSAQTLRTFTDWINYGESARGFNSDVAFITTYANASGSRVVNAVGGHGL